VTFQTNPQTQIEIELLAEALAGLAPEQILSFDEMTTLLGYPVKQASFWVLLAAREKVEKETGLRYGAVRGIGVRRLDAKSLPGIGMGARSRIGRLAKRHGKRLTGLRYNDIDHRLQARLDRERSLLGAIGVVASTPGNRIDKLTQTGPVAAEAIFDYLRPKAEVEP
jgi:hypothetical protein